ADNDRVEIHRLSLRLRSEHRSAADRSSAAFDRTLRPLLPPMQGSKDRVAATNSSTSLARADGSTPADSADYRASKALCGRPVPNPKAASPPGCRVGPGRLEA